ncbi:hypothetical protein P153DRAFT_351657 [Dothidotthia symphoricarpi CBS 119687]|uniref:MYND-type domain-containing protein n=1 Tax=Dothidotthia symphoricarpi CBS 119687 TaxID=1392245 RepID=A0A6A6A0B1_9PLEO|nr:uncharacterized protein P153DRAFT_351657 [Dothidotthia symphoricarpi CBS 119687]KAF2124021.1 hypothetical protein P153DRAFT_351657 [Dothidotthia symphoricarpi CBS 119687]
MPPRSVCLNVFTTSLGDANAAVRDDGTSAFNNGGFGSSGLERRDSAQSDNTQRSPSSSASPPPTSTSTSSFPAVHRPELFSSLRHTASTESFSFSLASKPCSTCSGGPAKLRCSRCKAAFYCDKACQKSAWKAHRTVCEPASQSQGYSAPATPNFSTPTSPVSES